MKTLIVVEQDFLKIHIGVLRVIMHYYQCLRKLSRSVDFATPRMGKLYLGVFSNSPHPIEAKPNREKPYWTSESKPVSDEDSTKTNPETNGIHWTDQSVNPNDYDINLISNPWLCALGLPLLPNAIGIVYDMVPNLIACGVLKLPVPVDVYKFAKDHDVGYCYYLANAKKITCISNSTKSDFLKLYKTAIHHKTIVADIPFPQSKRILSPKKTGSKNIILVNILDWRKNLLNTEKVLLSAASTAPLNVCIIGKERIPMHDALRFMERISNAGLKVEWHRNAASELLTLKYLESSVLLFPSLYEGLGLPVMEAQSFGIPAITSDTSALPEINMNKNLCFNPNDVSGMATSIWQVLEKPSHFISGRNLQETFNKFLNENHEPAKLFKTH